MSGAARPRLTAAEIRALDGELDAAALGHPASRLRPGQVSTNGAAVAGVDGYLFIGDGGNRWETQYAGPPPPESWKATWARVLAARQAEAEARRIQLWNLVIPEKQVVYPEARWPEGAPDGGARPLRRLAAQAGGDARLLYGEAALLACKAEGPACLRHDSHWTASGCLAVVRQLLSAAALEVDVERAVFSVARTREPLDLAAHFLEPNPPQDRLRLAAPHPRAWENRHYERTGQHTGSQYRLANPEAPDPRRVVLFGDSYSYAEGLAGALSALFAEVTCVWSKSVLWEVVDERRADLVVWESAERFLVSLPQS